MRRSGAAAPEYDRRRNRLARAAKAALVDVVANGTGRRIRDVFTSFDGESLHVGGKTGTGDNQRVIVDQRGERVATYARNRTAALVFFVDNYFGIITAHVEGPAAADYTFTSALPSQILRHLGPTLEPLFQERSSLPFTTRRPGTETPPRVEGR